MKKSALIGVIVILLTIVIFSFFLLKNKQENLSLSPGQSTAICNILSKNGEQGINLVFFSNKEKARRYSEFLLQISPFNENKEALNFYYIDEQADCARYKNIALLCYSKKLLKKASSCPSDYIIALKDEDTKIRSTSYMNVLSINTNHPLSVLPHEIGHAFANLAEEYVPAEIPKGSENCAKSCTDFQTKDGCYEGCSKENYYRSINKGVMRTLTSTTYGSLNEEKIAEELSKKSGNKITGKTIYEDCSITEYYLIEGFYNSESNKIDVKSRSIEKGCAGGNGNGGFEYKIVLEDNSIIQKNFNPYLIFTDAPGEDEIDGEVFAYTGNFILRLPLIKEATSLIILDKKSNTLANIEIDSDSRLCKLN